MILGLRAIAIKSLPNYLPTSNRASLAVNKSGKCCCHNLTQVQCLEVFPLLAYCPKPF